MTSPSPRSAGVLRITRTLPASRERVFDAFTKPELLTQWWGPGGFSLPKAELNLRVGGRYRFTMQPPDGNASILRGTFREIARPSKLVYTWAWDHEPGVETLVTIEFNETEGGTEVVLTQEPFATDTVAQQHDEGWQGGLDRLEQILRREKDG